MSKPSAAKGRVVILSGPSGAGKTTLHDMLLASPEFRGRIVRSISATTRAPRGQEKPGRDYQFLTRKMFEHKARTGQFLEWARVFDNYYGTPLKNVRQILRAGKSVLLCIDVQGGQQVKRKVPEAISVFVKTPSLAELRRRLEKRATDSKASLSLRLKKARMELRQAGRYDYVVVNDRLQDAFQELLEIMRARLPGRAPR